MAARVEHGETSSDRGPLEPQQEHRTPGVVRRALALWWLPVAGLLVGLVIGLVATRGGDGEFEATATVYLGRPLAPVGSSQLRSFQTDPSTVRQIVRSQAVVREVADEVGVGAGRLRRGVSTNVITRAFGRQIEQTEIVEITVRGPWRAETALAANDLADVVVTRVSSYPDAKIGGLERLLEAQNRELQDLETTLGDLGPAVSTGEGLSDELSTEFLTIVIANEQRRIQLRGDREQTEAALTQAREVERAQIVTSAAPVETAAGSERRGVILGAVIGLLVGALVALTWAATGGPRRAARAPTSAT